MLVVGILIGGALGALTRYGASLGIQRLLAPTAYAGWPLATLLVNVVGSFLLGALSTIGIRGPAAPAIRLALGTGFLGALTTFSTFELETHTLLRQGSRGSLTLYVLGNLVLGYLALVAGRWVGSRVRQGS